jgi:ABC-type transport system involved in multi-copper enzyme maturation permease subunit
MGKQMSTSEIQSSQVITATPRVAPRTGSKVKAIILNTFHESVRDRVLYNLILFVLLLVGASIFISELSIDQESSFIANLGLSSMLIFGALIAIFIGVGLVYKEIDRRTVYNILSKPVHRHEFIVGKYFGLCLTLLVNSAVMVLGIELALLYVNGKFVTLHAAMLPAAFLIYLELALIVAIALMFSSFSTPMLSALFTFALYIAGHFSADLKLAAQLTDSLLVRAILHGAYYLLPNLSNFSFISEASHGRVVPAKMIIAATVYAIVYISILLSASILIFQKRNFK